MKTAPARNRASHRASNGAKRKINHSGSSFDSFLEEQGIRHEVEAIAAKRVLAWQIARTMKQQQKTKQALARELRTSRSQLDRLLDPENTAVTLETVSRAAHALGKRLVVKIVEPPKRKSAKAAAS
jgi:DNA-binding phage protein